MTMGCQSNRNINSMHDSAPVIVYKTKANYSDLVPIRISEDKTTILSYPDPSDLKSGENYLTPIRLKKGYWLDQKGVDKHSAFLSINYKAYSGLSSAPDLQKLKDSILETDPFLEMYYCGKSTEYKDLVAELNEKIVSGQLKEMKKIK